MAEPLDTERLSRFLSLVLRHAPGAIGIVPDKAGWVQIADLIVKINHRAPGASKRQRSLPEVDCALIEACVAQDAKSRYEISADGARIRAAQGHSIEVDLGYPVKTPPEILYHGAPAQALPAIREQGLIAGQRHDVHLSQDPATAREVGARRGQPVILVVLAGAMARAGFEFRQSSNGVWLIPSVPAQYLRENAR